MGEKKHMQTTFEVFIISCFFFSLAFCFLVDYQQVVCQLRATFSLSCWQLGFWHSSHVTSLGTSRISQIFINKFHFCLEPLILRFHARVMLNIFKWCLCVCMSVYKPPFFYWYLFLRLLALPMNCAVKPFVMI